jgi:hypothetical protein
MSDPHESKTTRTLADDIRDEAARLAQRAALARLHAREKPSERISEEQLRILDDLVGPNDGFSEEAHPSAVEAVRLAVAEIRRYRALLVELVDSGCAVTDPLDDVDPIDSCFFCGATIGVGDPHRDDCPWKPIEAEVKAIREETRR